MIIVATVKILFIIFIAFLYFIQKGIFLDWKQAKEDPRYEELVPWEQIKFNAQFYTISFAIVTTTVFLLIFILSSVSIDGFFWQNL
jgi:hypothetical protein